MAGWLTRAASAFGRHSPPPAQAFDLPCDCGERLSGWRTESHQKLNCTHCDRPLLVLPADVYPAVKRSVPAKSLKSAPAVVQPDARSKTSSRRRSVKADPSAKASKSAAAAGEAQSAPPDDRINLSPMLRQSRSRRRSLRLIVVCILAMVVVTGWSLRNRARREQARAAIPEATEKGLAALHRGEFTTAAKELDIAAAALDTLRRQDETAQTIRQAHREAIAAQGLASAEIADLAAEFLSGRGALEERRHRFQADFGSQWLIFDVGVVNRVQDDKLVPELDIPLMVADRALQVSCDFPALRKFLESGHGETPWRVIFAAQLEDWQISEAPLPIVARIKPTTAFLWSDYDSYRAVGFQPATAAEEAETRSILNRQRQRESRP